MSPDEDNLARHALGLPNERNRSYRNRYFTTEDHVIWSLMRQHGLALWHPQPRIGEPAYGMFYLTKAGANAALRPGETLDDEDFPDV